MATATSFVKSRRVREQTFTLTYADTTASVVATLPAGARILAWICNTTIAFVTGTTTISIGYTSTSNELVSGHSVAAIGETEPSTTVALPGHETTALTEIYAKCGASNTAGTVHVTMVFSIEEGTPF